MTTLALKVDKKKVAVEGGNIQGDLDKKILGFW